MSGHRFVPGVVQRKHFDVLSAAPVRSFSRISIGEGLTTEPKRGLKVCMQSVRPRVKKLGRVTGGFLFQKELIAKLRWQGHPCELWDLRSIKRASRRRFFGCLKEIVFDLLLAHRGKEFRVGICFGVFEIDKAFDSLGFEIPHGGVVSGRQGEDGLERDLLADEIQIVKILPGGEPAGRPIS